MACEAFSNGWLPRPYQADARAAFAQGIQYHFFGWHRRAGKDTFALNIADELRRERVGTYWHLFPLHTQAKKAIWYGVNKAGERFIDQAFPVEDRAATRGGNDLQIEFKNGSFWQMCGSDRYDSLVGSNPVGVFFSEWALCDPRAWDYIRPILRENGGFACFITTFRGRNHAYRMAKRMAENAEWNVDIRTVDDTTDNEGRRILTPADIQAERDADMSEALIRQEYYCDPMAAVEGAVYGRAFETIMDQRRAGAFAHNPDIPVAASWSLFDDQHTVCFWQNVGNESHLVGSHSVPFASLSESLDAIDGAFPWSPRRHVVPPETSSDILEIFEKRELLVEPAPDLDAVTTLTRERLALTMVDNIPRDWTDGEPNNEHVIDSLNGYAYGRTNSGAWSLRPANTWEKHHARALEVFALWRHHEPDQVGGWHTPPSTAERDRATI